MTSFRLSITAWWSTVIGLCVRMMLMETRWRCWRTAWRISLAVMVYSFLPLTNECFVVMVISFSCQSLVRDFLWWRPSSRLMKIAMIQLPSQFGSHSSSTRTPETWVSIPVEVDHMQYLNSFDTLMPEQNGPHITGDDYISFWYNQLILISAWISNARWIYGIKLVFHSQTSTATPLKLGNGGLISSTLYIGSSYWSRLRFKLIHVS